MASVNAGHFMYRCEPAVSFPGVKEFTKSFAEAIRSCANAMLAGDVSSVSLVGDVESVSLVWSGVDDVVHHSFLVVLSGEVPPWPDVYRLFGVSPTVFWIKDLSELERTR